MALALSHLFPSAWPAHPISITSSVIGGPDSMRLGQLQESRDCDIIVALLD
jgi:hypothetical protein